MKNYSTLYRNALTGLLLVISIMAFGQINPYMKLPEYSSFDEIPYPFEVHKVKLNSDIELAYVDEGKGDKTIIFIHGLGSYLPAWKKNIAELSKDYRCIGIDLPGYGKSSKLPHSGKMTFYAEVVNQFAEALNLENIYIAGHSMGGQIAMVTSLTYPELVKGLILAAPAGFEYFTPGQKEWFRNVMTLDGVMKTPVDAIQTNLYYNFYKTPEDAEFMITDRIAMRNASDFEAYSYAVVQSVKGMVDEPVLDYLENIKIPVLIIFGENDNLIPNRFLNPGFTKNIAETGHSKLPNSTLVMLPKTGHFLQFENPEGFNKAVREFLK
ncbi:MAG: alpha/beta hydrolase [Bacteroidales bacterium]|nr:alpha/beta hydrolase [Bacteroidales bacterium]